MWLYGYPYNSPFTLIDITTAAPDGEIRAVCASQLADTLYVLVYAPNTGQLRILFYVTPDVYPRFISLGDVPTDTGINLYRVMIKIYEYR